MLDVDEGPVRFAVEEATVLAHKGVSVDSGARELAPGLSFEAGFEIRLSAP